MLETCPSRVRSRVVGRWPESSRRLTVSRTAVTPARSRSPDSSTHLPPGRLVARTSAGRPATQVAVPRRTAASVPLPRGSGDRTVVPSACRADVDVVGQPIDELQSPAPESRVGGRGPPPAGVAHGHPDDVARVSGQTQPDPATRVRVPVGVLDRIGDGLPHRELEVVDERRVEPGLGPPLVDGAADPAQLHALRRPVELQRGREQPGGDDSDIVRGPAAAQERCRRRPSISVAGPRSRSGAAAAASAANPSSSDAPRRSISPSVYRTRVEPGAARSSLSDLLRPPGRPSAGPQPSSRKRAPLSSSTSGGGCPGAAVGQAAADRVEQQAGRGADLRPLHPRGEGVEQLERAGGRMPLDQQGREGAPELAHDGGGRRTVPDDVADDDGHSPRAQREDVVPVAARLGPLHTGQVARRHRQPVDAGEGPRQQALLQVSAISRRTSARSARSKATAAWPARVSRNVRSPGSNSRRVGKLAATAPTTRPPTSSGSATLAWVRSSSVEEAVGYRAPTPRGRAARPDGGCGPPRPGATAPSAASSRTAPAGRRGTRGRAPRAGGCPRRAC